MLNDDEADLPTVLAWVPDEQVEREVEEFKRRWPEKWEAWLRWCGEGEVMIDQALIEQAAQAVADVLFGMQGGDPSWPQAPKFNEGDEAVAYAAVSAVADDLRAEGEAAGARKVVEAVERVHRDFDYGQGATEALFLRAARAALAAIESERGA